MAMCTFVKLTFDLGIRDLQINLQKSLENQFESMRRNDKEWPVV